MKIVFTLFCALFGLFLSTETIGAQAASTQTVPLSVHPATEKGMSEKEYYERMLSQTKEIATSAHSDLLATFAVEFGVIGLVVTLLVGGQIFSNYKINEQLLASFKSGINDDISKANAAIQEKFNITNSAVIQLRHDTEARDIRLKNLIKVSQYLFSPSSKSSQDEYHDALNNMLYFLESVDDANDVSEAVLGVLNSYTYNIKEYLESDYNRVNAILSGLLKDSGSLGVQFTKGLIDMAAVYRLEGPGPDKKKIYIRNPPTIQ
jgi:hypothetical protein